MFTSQILGTFRDQTQWYHTSEFFSLISKTFYNDGTLSELISLAHIHNNRYKTNFVGKLRKHRISKHGNSIVVCCSSMIDHKQKRTRHKQERVAMIARNIA